MTVGQHILKWVKDHHDLLTETEQLLLERVADLIDSGRPVSKL